MAHNVTWLPLLQFVIHELLRLKKFLNPQFEMVRLNLLISWLAQVGSNYHS